MQKLTIHYSLSPSSKLLPNHGGFVLFCEAGKMSLKKACILDEHSVDLSPMIAADGIKRSSLDGKVGCRFINNLVKYGVCDGTSLPKMTP